MGTRRTIYNKSPDFKVSLEKVFTNKERDKVYEIPMFFPVRGYFIPIRRIQHWLEKTASKLGIMKVNMALPVYNEDYNAKQIN